MELVITEGTIEAALDLEYRIPEFPQYNARSDYLSRLSDKNSLILIARLGNDNVGFKVGYAESPTVFYSWIGGVVPECRNLGIAKKLLVAQETWAKNRGFSFVNVNTYNRFPGMISMLVATGYSIVDFEAADHLERSKLSLVKKLISV